MRVRIGNVTLANPIMPASGAFSTDLAQVMDLNRLGALVAKTVSREFRAGNPPPRVAEVEGGMINSIGLPTKGIEY
ncbi:MAG TPA: dihydroorotate dehydrogenase, partial [Hyphomicrobiaceae bacterium]|nr:dihydroorotate dehydrogenase [Hyphomicrobiaceae bacterium]